MDPGRRGGFTLIELVVSVAVFSVVIMLVLSSLGRVTSLAGAYEQEVQVQQNFRFALDSITNDARQATSITLSGGLGDSLEMTEAIEFTLPGGHTVSYAAAQVDPAVASSPWVLRRNEDGTVQPVTEELPELLRVYFVQSGKKIFVVFVGRMRYFGGWRNASLVSLVWSRNVTVSGP